MIVLGNRSASFHWPSQADQRRKVESSEPCDVSRSPLHCCCGLYLAGVRQGYRLARTAWHTETWSWRLSRRWKWLILSVNASHFQHPQHCYSQHCKSHQNDSAARARGCRILPARCQTSISRRERREQNDPSWLSGSVLNPEIAHLVMMAGTSRAAGCEDGINIPSTNYATGALSLHKNDYACARHLQRGYREHDGCVRIAKWNKLFPFHSCVSLIK